MLLFTKAMLANPPDDEDDDRDDSNHLCKLDENNPDNDSPHMTHITVRALASLFAKTLLTAAIATFVISGALIIDSCALEAGV